MQHSWVLAQSFTGKFKSSKLHNDTYPMGRHGELRVGVRLPSLLAPPYAETRASAGFYFATTRTLQ